ncbi:SGNH/GDSL hydrolase family protein [Rhodobacteraceae bacterium B1Z28]|uniref:SGNH/GDSL hydrolase family protein n=1 Tax=Ruegeria haliotis TaxID=2747601 RepID=A0ABX2PQF7_9RHOB|nr:SGNH/GDSL hydrolase family protein [Ruegeria haliotis]NVO56367.1 SGNH/GDSL hydrolase family protein [Ruegeria haliotis]
MLKNLFLILFSAFISLALVEIGLRLFDPLNFEPHISRKQANVPLVNLENYFCEGGPVRRVGHDVVYSRETPNQSYFEVRNEIASFLEFNEYGFRGAFSSGDDKAQIMVLGDSFTRGTLADETETIPALLSQWSEDSYFVNLGTGGHGTLQHALTYDEFQDQIPHDTVLMFIFNRNDLIDNVMFQEWQENPGTRSHTPTFFQQVKRDLGKLYVGKLVFRFKHVLFDRDLYASTPTETEKALLFESLRHLSQSVNSNGARLFVFSLPDISEFIGEDTITFRDNPVGYADASRALIAQAAEENGFTYLNLKPALVEFSEDLGIPTSSLFGSPDHHMQEIGNFAVATTVARLLEDQGISAFEPDEEFVDRTRFEPTNIACP